MGAVALDVHGNIAAATSTGGLENQMAGRIGDSCIIGAGCFADNRTCAISGTGDGELLIKNVVAHNVSAAMEYNKLTLQQACNYVVHERIKQEDGDIGVIGVDTAGNIALAFNSARMHRGWKTSTKKTEAYVYDQPVKSADPEAKKEKEHKRRNQKTTPKK